VACVCAEPRDNINPRFPGTCVKCSKKIVEPEYDSSDATLGAFFDRLAESSFPAYTATRERRHLPKWFLDFHRTCSGRERMGRKKFGHTYLRRNNPAEAMEEAADLAIYLFQETLRRRRLGEDEEADIALTGALHAAKGFETAQRMMTHTFRSISSEDSDPK
jgi:hypothetical protein